MTWIHASRIAPELFRNIGMRMRGARLIAFFLVISQMFSIM
jgi:hypothetical protein